MSVFQAGAFFVWDHYMCEVLHGEKACPYL